MGDLIDRQRLLTSLQELKAVWEKYPVMAKAIKGVEAAIDYTKAIPSVAPPTQPNTFNALNALDCISRQAAIDAVIKRDANCGIDSAEVLKTLPSAQPETHGKRTETHARDLISRQAEMGDLLKRSKVERLILAKSLLEGVLNDITGMQNTVEMLECLYKRYDTYSSCTIDLCNFKMSWSACLQPERRWDI